MFEKIFLLLWFISVASLKQINMEMVMKLFWAAYSDNDHGDDYYTIQLLPIEQDDDEDIDRVDHLTNLADVE